MRLLLILTLVAITRVSLVCTSPIAGTPLNKANDIDDDAMTGDHHLTEEFPASPWRRDQKSTNPPPWRKISTDEWSAPPWKPEDNSNPAPPWRRSGGQTDAAPGRNGGALVPVPMREPLWERDTGNTQAPPW